MGETPMSQMTFKLGDFFATCSADGAEAAVVGGEAGVCVSRAFASAHRGAAGVGAGVPVAAAHHALHIRAGIGRTGWIGRGALAVISRTVNVLTPFRDIAVHVAQAPRIGALLPDRMRLLIGILAVPGELPKLVGRAKIERSVASRAGGVFPFRLGRQSVSAGRIIAIPLRRLLVVTNFQPFGARALVAICL